MICAGHPPDRFSGIIATNGFIKEGIVSRGKKIPERYGMGN
jgi:hypothetical protein